MFPVTRRSIAERGRTDPCGFLYLAGAAISGYFLLWQGVCILVAAMAAFAILRLAQSNSLPTSELGGMVTVGALMVASGSCVTLGLLVLALRRLSGRRYPGPRALALFVVLSIGLVGTTRLVSVRMNVPAAIPANYPGLEGGWRQVGFPTVQYRFRPDGKVLVASAWGEGEFGTWTRLGPTVTIRAFRDWHMVGTLTKSRIAGTMFQTSAKKPIGGAVWVRDVVP